MKITIPEMSLIVLAGASGSGKSTFAKKFFKETEIVSSDVCRGIVSDNENDQTVTTEAFELLRFITAKRLSLGRLTVVDATNIRMEDRKPSLQLARDYHCLPVAIVLDMPEKLCHQRNRERPDRNFGEHVVRQQRQQLRRSLRSLKKEGFQYVYVLKSPEEIEGLTIERRPLWNDLRNERGPFDIIGDVHGCFAELCDLLEKLGYTIKTHADKTIDLGFSVEPPPGRKAIFLGDLVDRGPDSPNVLRLVMSMVKEGTALCVPGNHDMKLLKKLKGKEVQLQHGLNKTLEQLAFEPEEFQNTVAQFLDKLVSHYVLDGGKLVVAHAGLREDMQGRASGAVRAFCLYGETTGETDEFGLPVRLNWAAEYRGKAMVVYGHTPVPEPEWVNRTINIDTGCVFGGKLTALRYPEKELVSIPALKTYYESVKPLQVEKSQPELSAQQQYDDVLDIEDVIGKRIISTGLQKNITIREENAIVALEVITRFAINPKWLIYLPPTMSPSETSKLPGLLEHPAEAFAYYSKNGVEKVICEEKHMGSRAVIIVCRDLQTVLKRFGIAGEDIGACYTRTGRPFFNDQHLEKELLNRIKTALDNTGFWKKFQTDWVCLDCEIMPWSAKAQFLLESQYAPVGAASNVAIPDAIAVLEQAQRSGIEVNALLENHYQRKEMVGNYRQAYRQYCWPVQQISDYKVAPFHFLAAENALYFDKDHQWHMESIREICEADTELLLATPYKLVELHDEQSKNEGIQWWENLTFRGGEGMVVKPFDFVVRGRHGLVQPAIKCRGKEYLRIIYGPEYTAPENLVRLKNRGLSAKRSLALREFALGIESLERFVMKEPLRKVHECVFGVLALESEPVDPRL